MSIKGRRAVITGSNSGVGLGIAEELAKFGADVALNSFSDNDEDDALAKRIADEHDVRVVCIQADMSDGGACRALVRKTAEALGGVDILVNDAGIQHVAPIPDVLLARQPSKALATVEQLGGGVAFLCSPAADQITGTTFSVDGGWIAL